MSDDSSSSVVNEDTKSASAYPADGPVEVQGFAYRDDLYLTRGIEAVQMRGEEEDADYIVARRYCSEVKLRLPNGSECTFPIEVPCGLLTDLSSVPRWGRWLLGKVGAHLEASIVHDWLYVAWQDEAAWQGENRPPGWMRRFADDVFLAAMKEAGVGRFKRSIAHAAVCGFGRRSFYKKSKATVRCVWDISRDGDANRSVQKLTPVS